MSLLTTSFQILDPHRQLPAHTQALFPADAQGVLEVLDHRFPIHADTVARIASGPLDRTVTWTPTIPIATELGLPRFPALLRWTPNRSRRTRALGRLRSLVQSGPAWPEPLAIDATTEAEQLHYYGDHFAALQPSPLQVSVIVTNTCNLKCGMCPYHSPSIRPLHTTDFFDEASFIDWELLDRLATECGRARLPVKMGNIEEPLLHPRLLDFIRACRERGVPSVHITSNGLLIDEERGRALLEAGLTSLYVSIDASREETYKLNRGAKLAKVERNLRRFIELREELGKPCSVMTSFVKNEGTTGEEALEFRDKWAPTTDGVIFYNLATYTEGNSHYDQVHAFANQKRAQAGGRWPCLNPFQEIYVLPDGRVYYCCETVSKLAFEKLATMGDYPRQTLREIWGGERFAALRRDLIRDELKDWSACQDCGIWLSHVTDVREEDGFKVTRNMITEIVQPR